VLKTALAVTAASFVFVTVALSSQVSLLNQSAAPGSSILVGVVFFSQDASISGVQFDVQFDSSAMGLNATLGDLARHAEKSLYQANLGPNKRRFLIVGLNQRVIADGPLINLLVNLNQNATTGPYALKLSNLAATDPDGHSVPITGTDGAVTVKGMFGQGPRLLREGILNAGSLLPGPLAPGEVVTLIGAGIGPASSQQPVGSSSSTVLAGASVLFDGTPAPLLYAEPSQINAVVPYGVSGKTATQLEVTSQGEMIARVSLSTAATVPAIFTLNSSGVGPGAILNQDLTVNSPSNPAGRGSAVSVFATGAGQTDPPGIDGQVAGTILPSPLLPVSVRIGGLDAQTLYAGGAPGLIAGVIQVSCLIPIAAPSGLSVPIVLTIGPASSQAGVTLAIK
jgi:uncharacterized protein (TIGR03437 family)